MRSVSEVDILESDIRRRKDLLGILLKDRTTRKNIIWATDSYYKTGKKSDPFAPKRQIKPKLITCECARLIQPRAAKNLDEQKRRTKESAEVFTPLDIVDNMNRQIDEASCNWPVNENNWQQYVKEVKLEITCGEAPFIVSRYDPTAHTGKLIPIYKKNGLPNRVGFLDRKLFFVSKYCQIRKDWLFWAIEACKASYGYEWQGDNLLIARENILYSIDDYYRENFGSKLSTYILKDFAKIISWNIFQMDGLKYVIPMSCHKTKNEQPKLVFVDEEPEAIDEHECEGCRHNQPTKHNGKYVKIMDWEKKKTVRFIDLV